MPYGAEARDNAKVHSMRRFLIALSAVVCSTSCGGSDVTPAPPAHSTEMTVVATTTTPATPSNAGVPPLSPQALAAGFVDIRTVIPDAIVDLRYATPNNFVGTPMYPPDARCLVHESMAPGLAAAADKVRAQGEVLLFWDCYRPHDVQVRMWQAMPNANWVARPGTTARSHETGRSVDVTLASVREVCPPTQQVGGGCLADMGTDFDDFSPRALAFATDGVSPEAQANRAELRDAMSAGGLTVYSGEWWHFDGPGANIEREIVDVPVN